MIITKSQKKLNRNAILSQALDKIKSHAAAKDKTCTIKWMLVGNWNREVHVDDEPAFVQSGGEMIGSFVGAFVSLTV